MLCTIFIQALFPIRQLTRSVRSLVRFLILLNSWIRIVRAHFPWNYLYNMVLPSAHAQNAYQDWKPDNDKHFSETDEIKKTQVYSRLRGWKASHAIANCKMNIVILGSKAIEIMTIFLLSSSSYVSSSIIDGCPKSPGRNFILENVVEQIERWLRSTAEIKCLLKGKKGIEYYTIK